MLWAEKGAMGRIYDVMAIWRERGTNVTGRALPVIGYQPGARADWNSRFGWPSGFTQVLSLAT